MTILPMIDPTTAVAINSVGGINVDMDFEAFFKANERRIHYQIHRLGVADDLYAEFYSEGIFALWRAYKKFDPSKGNGNIGTYMNYQIRYRLIELIRKHVRDREVVEEANSEKVIQLDDGNRFGTTGLPVVDERGILLNNEAFWREVRSHLTENQWKWVKYFVIANLSVKEITEIEGVSAYAVKSWGREVRRKLRDERVKERLEKLL